MKRRVLSFVITLMLCLNLCPVQAFAADEGTDGSLCPHHPAHTDECGYVPESSDVSCTFVCQVCPVEDLIGKLPGSVSEDNSEQVQAQLSEIYALYDGLTADEQQQVDLSPCISLWEQMNGAGFAALSDTPGGGSSDPFYHLENNDTQPVPFEVKSILDFNTMGHTFTGTGSAAIQVTGTGKLYLTGTVSAPNGVGVEVLSGLLSITEPETSITGKKYALDIASGTTVQLSAGTYLGTAAAIHTADGDLAALLKPGYAYFDGDSGDLLLPATAATAKKLVIGQCSDHPNKSYIHSSGTTEHTWNCPHCVTKETEKCTFTFGQDGRGTCACGNTIAIVVSLDNLIYDGTVKPGDVSITVTLDDGSDKELVSNTDYNVDCESRTDPGEITVTVTGMTFNGTFTKTYNVEQDQPRISWNAAYCAVDYDSNGLPVDSKNLSNIITITINASEDLHPYLQYFWKAKGAADTEFTNGLPTNAGEYEIKAYLPASQNYKEAETESYLPLTINKIPAVKTEPTAKTLTYNREAQELVTAGALKPGAIAESAKIEFKLETNSTYSTNIPTGTGVSSYNVYYRVAETTNYSGVSETLIANPDIKYPSARINHKEITPTVELSYYTTVYTGEAMKPVVTVKDGEYIIPNNEYIEAYTNNTDVGTATVTVKNASNGDYNYKLTTATATFQITSKEQAEFSIINQPNTVIYGDTFTLGTQGGSGDGNVTWEIMPGSNAATVDGNSGKVTVVGVGAFTVKATKSGKDPATGKTNYDDATAFWTFTAEKKKATATVTAADKTYDSDTAVTLTVIVSGLLSEYSSGSVTASGHFKDANAGTNKTVVITGLNVPGDISAKYEISYPNTITASITPAAATVTEAPKKNEYLTKYTGQPQTLVTPGEAANGNMAYSLDGINYSFTVPEGTDAKTYTVWYKAVATDKNHKDSTPDKVTDAAIGVNTGTPTVKCVPDTFQFDGTAKTLTVVVQDSEQRIIPEDEYTYTVTFGESTEPVTSAIEVGTYTVTVTDKSNSGNYEFTEPVTGSFEIVATSQNPLSIITDKSTVNYGDSFRLNAMGGSGSGAIQWRIEESGSTVATIDPNGVVTVKGVGGFTVQAYRDAADGYSKSNTASVPFYANPKPVTAVARAVSRGYNTEKTTNVTVTVPEINATIRVTGTFDDANVGTNKTVTIVYGDAKVTDPNYAITWPDTTTASIDKVDAKIETAPQPNSRVYDMVERPLVTGGSTAGNIGTIVYSTTENGAYSTDIPTGTEAGKYTVWYKVEGSVNYTGIPAVELKVEIAMANAQIENAPHPNDLTYVAEADDSPKAQALVTGGSTAGNIGTIVYSTTENGEYSETIPTGKNAGRYTVWYKVADSVNYTGIPAVELKVEIEKATPTISPDTVTVGQEQSLSEIDLKDVVKARVGETVVSGTFAWKNGSIKPENGKSYDVIFTPKDTGNYNSVTFEVKVTITASESDTNPGGGDVAETNHMPVTSTLSTSGTSTQTTVRNGTANTVLSTADGSKLVRDAVANQSRNVVIKPDIAGDVTKTEVSIPSSTVSRLGSETNAALTVSSPVADVTIPNKALGTLSQAGGAVSVVTEQVDQSVVLTVTAGGKTVEQVPGGVTLTVPAEDAGPGTVAVLVHDDGTRETVRKSVVEDGVMSIPLSGSATVEIVDNSKDFTDVSPESWAADAVDFASSHELFSGTSETTFSPDQTMSRGMLATVLYNLEGQPDQDQAVTFRDVDSDAWYADGVSWATENGIAGGYGDGKFGPNDNITREQFVVMLWRYAGSPKASSLVLDFADADQASSYAQEALCWAVENGVLRGKGSDVLDPGGTTTRAQAAQLLKNFMENT